MEILFLIIFQIALQAASHGIRSRRCDWYWHSIEYIHLLFWFILVGVLYSEDIKSDVTYLSIIIGYILTRFALFDYTYNVFAEKRVDYLGINSIYDKILRWTKIPSFVLMVLRMLAIFIAFGVLCACSSYKHASHTTARTRGYYNKECVSFKAKHDYQKPCYKQRYIYLP